MVLPLGTGHLCQINAATAFGEDKIIHFLFEGEITEVQKLRILQSTQYEDKNGPYGLSKSHSGEIWRSVWRSCKWDDHDVWGVSITRNGG